MSEIEAEKKELNLLINRGASFEVERTVYLKPTGLFRLFKKLIKSTEKIKFVIKEPTLTTLDLIASEQIDLNIDERVMSSEQGISEAKRLAKDHAKRMAKIVALAVLGQDYVIAISEGKKTRYEFDDERLDELTGLFFNNLKPSKLMQLTLLVNTMSNLGDFINSIRLMSGARTTMPIRIEEEEV